MRAMVYTAPGEIVLRDEPEPRLSAGEVMVRVGAAGICGSDLEGFASRSPRRVPPLIMGHEFGGTVVDTGAGVERLRTGDRVAVNPLIPCGRCRLCKRGLSNACRERVLIGLKRPGAFTELVAVPETAAYLLPDSSSYSYAAMVEPLANAVHAVRISGVSIPGARVMMMGAGTIGLVCLQASLVAGAAATLVVDVDDRRLQTALDLGATRAVNARSDDLPSAVGDLTGDDGFDLVLDAVGRQDTRRNGLSALSPGGVAVWIGSAQDTISLAAYDIILHERRVQGSYAYADIDYVHAFELIVHDRVDFAGWIQHFPLEAGPDVFLGLLDGSRPGLIKAQLVPV